MSRKGRSERVKLRPVRQQKRL